MATVLALWSATALASAPSCEYDAEKGTAVSLGPAATCNPGLGSVSTSASTRGLGSKTQDPGQKGAIYDYIQTHTFAYRSDEAPKRAKGLVRVGVAAIGIGNDTGDAYVSKRLQLALQYADWAGEAGCDALLLPETFTGPSPLPMEGNVTRKLAEKARQYGMYVVFGLQVQAQSDDTFYSDLGPIGYNAQLILSRNGSLLQRYYKQFPCCVDPQGRVGKDGYPSRIGARTLDLPDIGRVGFLTCYDANFMEAWQQLYAERVDLVFWPSAYGGGQALRAYAALFNYAIVPAGWGDITDVTGRVVEGLSQPHTDFFVGDLDLDQAYAHFDFNDNMTKLLKDYEGDIEEVKINEYCSESGKCSRKADLINQGNRRLIRRTPSGMAKNLSVRALFKEYNIVDVRSYLLQARRQIERQRQTTRAPEGFNEYRPQHWPGKDYDSLLDDGE